MNKQHIKNYINRSITGKISKEEIKSLQKVLINYNREEWKKLIAVCKELFDEFIEEELAKIGGEKLPIEWKDDIKNLARSIMNFTFAICNENVFYGGMQLEKQGNLNEQQKITKLSLLMLPEIKKVAARSNNKVANYHKTEVGLSEKMKELFTIGKWLKDHGSKKDMKDRGKKFFDLAKGLTADEILVLKKKLKGLAMEGIKNFASHNTVLFKGFSQGQEITKSLLDLIDAIADEKLTKEFINVGVKYLEKCIENDKKPTFSFKSFKKTGLENEVKNLITGLTNHLNKLAGEGAKEEKISPEDSEKMLAKILTEVQQDNPNPERPNEDYGNIFGTIGDSMKVNIEKAFTDISSGEVMDRLENSLTTTQSKGKWYQSPWFIGFSIVGTLAVGGLTVWFFMKKKARSRRVYN